jgi:hypothetical protein
MFLDGTKMIRLSSHTSTYALLAISFSATVHAPAPAPHAPGVETFHSEKSVARKCEAVVLPDDLRIRKRTVV